MTAVRKPDVEFRRRVEGPGPPGNRNAWRTYGHIYWRPLIVVLLGRVLLGRRSLRRSWEAAPEPEIPYGESEWVQGKPS